jgi:hypothetical protein
MEPILAMRRRMLRTYFPAPLLLAVTGCIFQPAVPVATELDGPPPVAEPVVERQLTVAPEDDLAAPAPTSEALRAAPRDPVSFPIGAGYGALARVDFAGCRERGLAAGYLRVRATFNRVGYIVRASVESPKAPPAAALDCIADGLRQTGVPAFDGTDVRLSRTYFVQPPGAQPEVPGTRETDGSAP